MGKKRVDIREMVGRLCQPNREDIDVEAVSDAIDFLEYIDDSYAKEKSFLVAELKKSDDDETLNFIICVLRIINNTLDEGIIGILGEKVDLIFKKNTTYYFSTLEYILQYFSKQGSEFKTIIIPILLKIIRRLNCNLICKCYAFYILWKWLGFWNAVSAVKKGLYNIPYENQEP